MQLFTPNRTILLDKVHVRWYNNSIKLKIDFLFSLTNTFREKGHFMIEKIYDSDRLDKVAASAVLELDSSQVSRLFNSGKIRTYKDTTNNKIFTTEADIISYLAGRLPSGYSVKTKTGDDLTPR